MDITAARGNSGGGGAFGEMPDVSALLAKQTFAAAAGKRLAEHIPEGVWQAEAGEFAGENEVRAALSRWRGSPAA